MFTAMATIKSKRLPWIRSPRTVFAYAGLHAESHHEHRAHQHSDRLAASVHGVTDFGIPLAKTIPTWAELLKQNGYQTAAFIGAVVLDSRTLAPGLDRGFDYYDNFPSDSSKSKHWGRVERRAKM